MNVTSRGCLIVHGRIVRSHLFTSVMAVKYFNAPLREWFEVHCVRHVGSWNLKCDRRSNRSVTRLRYGFGPFSQMNVSAYPHLYRGSTTMKRRPFAPSIPVNPRFRERKGGVLMRICQLTKTVSISHLIRPHTYRLDPDKNLPELVKACDVPGV